MTDNLDQEKLEIRAGIVLACPRDSQSSDFCEDVWEAVREGATSVRIVSGEDPEDVWMLVSERPLSDEDAAEWLRLELLGRGRRAVTEPGGWEEDTLVGPGPETVRMPTSRPPEAGPWETVPPVFGVLVEGRIWAPLPVPGRPAPGEVLGHGAYGRT